MTTITKARGRNVYARGEALIITPAQRAKLEARGRPYFHRLQPDLHLGYRKCVTTTGTWTARRTIGQDRYEFEPIGFADDAGAPEGALDFAKASTKAKAWFATAAKPVSITVRDAITAYRPIRDQALAAKRGNAPGKAKCFFWSAMARVRASSLIDVELNKLTKAELKQFRQELAASTTPSGSPLSVGTVKRITQDLSAALNYAAHENDAITLTSDVISTGLRAAKGEVHKNSRPPQVLLDRDIVAIVAAAREVDAEAGFGGDLFRLVLVLAATGARFSQVQCITVGDVDVANGEILVPVSRKGRGEKKRSHNAMPVPADVMAALAPVLNGRRSTDYLLERRELVAVEGAVAQWQANGRGPWQASTELTDKHWRAILKRAGLAQELVCYCLRHSSIVKWLRQRFPTQFVAEIHDTSSEMIEQNYARHIGGAFRDLARQSAQAMTLAGAEVVALKAA